MKTLNGITFLETKDIKKALQIGNKTCLDLFNKKDFPGKKIGKSWLVMEEAFKDYFKFQQNNRVSKRSSRGCLLIKNYHIFITLVCNNLKMNRNDKLEKP